MLDSFFANDSTAIIKETCNVLLKNHSFAYDGGKIDQPDKVFRSSFVLQLLANAHIRACFGCLDVPALRLSAETNRARGAIALCVAAVRFFDYNNLTH